MLDRVERVISALEARPGLDNASAVGADGLDAEIHQF